jgi:hypothetical protein
MKLLSEKRMRLLSERRSGDPGLNGNRQSPLRSLALLPRAFVLARRLLLARPWTTAGVSVPLGSSGRSRRLSPRSGHAESAAKESSTK